MPAALKPFSADRLIGNGDLWTRLPRPRTFTTSADGWTRLKHPWFRLADGQLTIDGHRVDGGSGSFRADIPPMESYPRSLNQGLGPGFIPSALDFSTNGCWKVIAHFRDSKVVLYVDVSPRARDRAPA